MRFTKLQGLGNDYIYLSLLPQDENRVDLKRIDLAELARRLCRRRFGIGGDGLIIIEPGEDKEFRMRIFNPDGSEAEMCGNGIRGMARYLWSRGLTEKKEIIIETKAGEKKVRLTESDEIEVDMGEPILRGAEIPVEIDREPVIDEEIEVGGERIRITAVSLGNPHCLVFVEGGDGIRSEIGYLITIPTELVNRLGPELEVHPLFPQRTNVEFVRIKSRKELELRTWERGAGETLACGTGACAALVGAVLKRLTEREVRVHLLGGDLEVHWRRNGHVYLIGSVQECFQGTFRLT
ncbi:diaminopimelate epimerase [candidate division WOR-3 bacterium]|uniref:Diaminopimelate epimerase n=1 Tax=candidate division WOR-3 bacterium TaxID=2052148 RepID=A0A660SEI1_UNCW3|nr:MAG: diaminopimelate epimerase [candidate division WOR-3 bacterium]